MKAPRLQITIQPTFDRAFEIRGHCCRTSRSAILFTIMDAAAAWDKTVPVYTHLSPAEFYSVAQDVYGNTQIENDVISGSVLGSPWRVKIYELLQNNNPETKE